VSPSAESVPHAAYAAVIEPVRRRLVANGVDVSHDAVVAALRELGLVLDERAVAGLARDLRRDLRGLGPLQPLVVTPGVTDVLVNGSDSVWFDRGAGLEPAGAVFPDDAAVRRFGQRLAASVARSLDDAHPWVDARLPSGIRLHAVLPPVAERPTLSLRVPSRCPLSVADLVSAGSLPGVLADVVPALVRCRAAFLVTGGTGTGKTTLLSALLGEVPAAERVVVVEDTAELFPEHPHVVRLQARPPNAEGSGAVTLSDLVRQAMRMRPDRLVVGEVRGAEVVDLLSALNTGHEGGCGTVHANRARDLPARVESLAAAAGMDRGAAHSQLAAAVDAVVHVTRSRGGERRVSEVSALARTREGWVETLPAWSWSCGRLEPGPGRDLLMSRLRSEGS
jgi:pilus assembly protein CpaF